ncbi:hypothetical protein DFJ63DRAFT_335055 [Scheffersomyces coipomensis]|uniref:uncharacterized protein n=1 Tax=Scheffersomyces coipomensis TaxID=1788519 RepID=UPI00315C5216
MLFHGLIILFSLAAHINLVNSLNIRSNSHNNNEFGSYVNPNPRPYEACPPTDTITLNSCCNVVLTKLDDCKADDLACECCALQSIKQECYHLCPSNPSAKFLSVLVEDCSGMKDINACAIPFKKDDQIGTQKSFIKAKVHKFRSDNTNNNNQNSVTIKSKVVDKLSPNFINGNEESLSAKSKIKLILEHHENNNNDEEDDDDKDFINLVHNDIDQVNLEDEDVIISKSSLNSTLDQVPSLNSSLNESTYFNASGCNNNDETTSGTNQYSTKSIVYSVFITVIITIVAAFT